MPTRRSIKCGWIPCWSVTSIRSAGRSEELARRVGGHGGMDFIMDYRLVYSLHRGLPLDMDVYDAAEWSCIVELSERSVVAGSRPVEIPDFTRGAWQKLSRLEFAGVR